MVALGFVLLYLSHVDVVGGKVEDRLRLTPAALWTTPPHQAVGLEAPR